MWVTALLLGSSVLQLSSGYYTLKLLDILQLPTSIRSGSYLYSGINLGTAKAAAYDPKNYMLYVIGDTSHLLHVIDLSDPNNIQLELIHQFTIGEGIPQSIDVCGNEVAVGLSATTDVLEGHVMYFHTHTKGSGATDLTLDGYMTVGPHPSHIKFTSDCNILVIANEGQAGKDSTGAFVDPEGSVTLIENERVGNPTAKLVDFQQYNYGSPNYNQNLRVPSLAIPPSTHTPRTTVSKDIEPENIAITADGKSAWVSLQENNAVAEISLTDGIVSDLIPLPRKNWTGVPVDISDRDGGVHRRLYPGLQSLRQPGKIKTITINKKTFLVTADEGAVKTYTSSLHGFAWSDTVTARSIVNSIEPQDLKTLAGNDELLGRLQVSDIDGRSPFSPTFTHLEGFGGRGFSIWDTSDFSRPIFDSEGTLEEYMEAWDKNVFNTDYIKSTESYQSPEMTRDAASDNMGAKVTGLDIQDDNGTMFLLVGTSSTGTLYLYTVNTSNGRPEPLFQAIYRQGTTDLPWRDLYKNQTLGDLYISDLGIITSEHSPTDKPMAYVVSEGSGQVSLYEIVEEHGIIPPNTPGPIGSGDRELEDLFTAVTNDIVALPSARGAMIGEVIRPLKQW